MSWRATAFVKPLRLSRTGKEIVRGEKFVLLVLADYHNDEKGYASVSVNRLADECLYERRQVIRIIKSLEDKEFIVVVREKNLISGNEINRYIVVGVGKDKMSPDGTKEDKTPPPSGDIPGGGDSDIPASKMSPEREVLTGKPDNKNKTPPSAPAEGPGKSSSKGKEPEDPRHGPVAKMLCAAYKKHNQCEDGEIPFRAQQAGKLARLLKQNPKWGLKFIQTCIENRFASEEINPAEAFDDWFLSAGKLIKYRNGPLNKFGRPMNKSPVFKPAIASDLVRKQFEEDV